MRLHIDGIIFSLQHHGGISVYFRELLSRFTSQHQVTLTLEQPVKRPVDAASMAGIRQVEHPARAYERLRKARALDIEKPTVFHSTYYRRPELRGQPSVVTVHDFTYQRFMRGPRGWMHRWLMNGSITKAQHIICISEATRQDLLEFIPVRADQQVSVIHNGVSALFRPLKPSGTCTKLSTGRPFMLFVGQRAGYKNFWLALQALESLPDLELHCVGGGNLQPEELACISEATRSRVRHLGFIDDEQLNVLYNQAYCLLYPSAHEGFGIPVLEAMQTGCPVVSVGCKAVVEVGGPALLVSQDASDPLALVDAIRQLEAAGRRTELRDMGIARSGLFSWDKCFEQTLGVYRSF
jgi:mannosyltransferase